MSYDIRKAILTAKAVAKSAMSTVPLQRAAGGQAGVDTDQTRDFTPPKLQGTNIVKEPAGQWLSGSVENQLDPLKTKTIGTYRGHEDPAKALAFSKERLAQMDARDAAGEASPLDDQSRQRLRGQHEEIVERAGRHAAVNDWIGTTLKKYIQRDMGSQNDPVRELAERGITHIPDQESFINVNQHGGAYMKRFRREAGMPENPQGQSDLARSWENASDIAIRPHTAQSLTDAPGAVGILSKDPWIKKLDSVTRIYSADAAMSTLGFNHLRDELHGAIDPASDFPANLKLRPEALKRMSVPQAVEHVHKINEWRSDNKAKADREKAFNPAVHLHKDYPDSDYAWYEIKKPVDGKDEIGKKHTLDALKYEGNAMGHCVGTLGSGHPEGVLEGSRRVFSLRNKKTGEPHITIETTPHKKDSGDYYPLARQVIKENPHINQSDPAGAKEIQRLVEEKYNSIPHHDSIDEIKGKSNHAIADRYTRYGHDFVRSQPWENVGDLENLGLNDMNEHKDTFLRHIGDMKGRYLTDKEIEDGKDEYWKDFEYHQREWRAAGGAVDDNDMQLPQRNLNPQGLYSAAAEAARNLPQQRGSPQQMIASLKGVKPEEIARSGVHERFGGQKSVTKDELADHFEKSLPDLQESSGGSKFANWSTSGGQNYRELLMHLPPNEASQVGGPGNYRSNHWGAPNIVAHLRMSDRPDGSVRKPSGPPLPNPDKIASPRWASGPKQDEVEPKPGWSVAPGLVIHRGLKNPKEFTITHQPSGMAAASSIKSFWGAKRLGEIMATHQNWERPAKDVKDFYSDAANKAANEERILHARMGRSDAEDYPLFHAPPKDVMDAWQAKQAGKKPPAPRGKALLLDELQSDWGQAGRSKGFIGDPDAGSGAVPKGPYVGSTQGWTDLGLKRALMEAAKGGHDHLAWTPGEKHADRYNLRKHISRIDYRPNDSNGWLTAHDLHGRQVLSKTGVSPNDLPEHIGGELSAKLMHPDSVTIHDNGVVRHHLSGGNLEIGGEGMKGYYNNILPKRLLALAKEHDPDAKIEPLKSKDKHVNGFQSVEITPKMRQSILSGGFKAYKRGGSVIEPTDNSKRILIHGDGSGGVKGIVVPKHMWEGGTKIEGMKEINKARAKVYGPENRDPLTLGQMGSLHRKALEEHFAKPVEQQLAAEEAALSRLRAAKHLSKDADTLDESEKLDTVRHEHDEQGRAHVGYASKGVAGHSVYTSGTGEREKHNILNTCPGQTNGCSGGVDEHGVVDTLKGTCFAPRAEAQYAGAAVRRACHEQAKHDPKMSKDWVLAHTGSLRNAARLADKNNLVTLFRPNVVDESDVSSRHVIRHLNRQRMSVGLPKIIANSYGKTNELHDPENGYFVTHSNVGPKVKHGSAIAENISRDKQRVRSTVLAQEASGKDFVNDDGHKTPPKNSYMVTDVKRHSDLDRRMQAAITHAKYWGTGRTSAELSAHEQAEGPEGHFDGEHRPTTPEKAHYGHTTVAGKRYDYQKQHILHPRMVQVGHNEDGSPHMIPTDSRFKDNDFLPKDRFISKTGKHAGAILMTTPTESTSGLLHQSAFTHHVGEESLQHAKSHAGEYEIDSPHQQATARGEYMPPQPITFRKGRAFGGAVDADGDDGSFPEQNFLVQAHNAHRSENDRPTPVHNKAAHDIVSRALAVIHNR